jgi:hypothetical protein
LIVCPAKRSSTSRKTPHEQVSDTGIETGLRRGARGTPFILKDAESRMKEDSTPSPRIT